MPRTKGLPEQTYPERTLGRRSIDTTVRQHAKVALLELEITCVCIEMVLQDKSISSAVQKTLQEAHRHAMTASTYLKNEEI